MPQQFLTQQDYSNFGSDLVDFTQRAAVQAVAPHLESLEQQNAELQRRLAREARHALDARVERAIPDFREIDSDPSWLNWLAQLDPLSGRQRQQLLNEAIAASDTGRVLGFFRQFQREAGAASHTSGHDLGPAHSRRTRSSGSGGAVYTRPQIQRLYEMHRRGAYAGREDAWARQEADIVRAGAEGRILNPDIITK
jgi:hypothetical protein